MTKRVTVLVLEDEPIVAFALEDMLFELGFEEVRLAYTLEAALHHLEARVPDIAILDVNIRGQRSYGVADKLKDARIPFIFATGYGRAEHPESLQATPTLTKPYNLEDLKAILAPLTNPT